MGSLFSWRSSPVLLAFLLCTFPSLIILLAKASSDSFPYRSSRWDLSKWTQKWTFLFLTPWSVRLAAPHPRNASFLALAEGDEGGRSHTGAYSVNLHDWVRWTVSKMLKVWAFRGCLGGQIISSFALSFLLNLLLAFSWPQSISGNCPWQLQHLFPDFYRYCIS